MFAVRILKKFKMRLSSFVIKTITFIVSNKVYQANNEIRIISTKIMNIKLLGRFVLNNHIFFLKHLILAYIF